MPRHPISHGRRAGPRGARRLLVAALAMLPACHGTGRGPGLTANWTGSTGGAWSGPAVAVWCQDEGRLEVTGIEQDLAIGLAVYPESILAAGEYPAFDPGITSARRPGAAAALRNYTDRKVLGFQSDSGGFTLRRAGREYQGRFVFRLRSLEGSDTIRLRGAATGIVAGSCPSPRGLDAVPDSAAAP